MNARLATLCPRLDPAGAGTALYEKGRAITYGELCRGAATLSENLRNTGAPSGSRIGLCLDNTSAFVYGYLGILGAGYVPVLMSTGLPAEKHAYLLEDSGAAGFLGDARALGKIPSLPPALRFAFTAGGDTPHPLPVYPLAEAIHRAGLAVARHCGDGPLGKPSADAPGELASLIYTSGSTGKPKGVMLSVGNLELASSVIVEHLALCREDTCLVTMSFCHCAGLLHLLAHLRAGAKVVTGESPALMGGLLAAIKRHGVTVLPAVPSFYALLLKYPREKVRPYLTGVRAVETSSAMINGSLIREMEELFPGATVFNTYGLTEAPRATYLAMRPSEDGVTLSVGIPTWGVTVRVVDEELAPRPPYQEGEVVISGPNLALGYWNRPEKTAQAFGAWGFRTGDVGYLDSRGRLFLKGRRDDMVRVGAHTVYPAEIENVAAGHPGVAEVLAYGVRDEILGGAIHLKVVRGEEGVDAASLQEYLSCQLERHQLPAQILFCDAIELEESGKPKRGQA